MEHGVTIYGITTCDTVRKARRWLDAEGVAYRYHDLRKDGLSAEELAAWVKAVGWEKLLNKSGMTFRKLPETDKQVSTEAQAVALMLAHPTVIKRPVLMRDGAVTLGFKPELYAAVFAPTS
ncbi:FIG138056: a glutathione-dependent thiol reductase [Asaia bogorensis]|uniref:FIG138056: a glutathione-dependent thiol reductase n=1 Tax=Asaia bogorensis TaxID=91915 RepID=A0A060QG37_9PROT|nr:MULTISPECIES: ArsC family reductase [Asaia]CDG38191.1 FIG138056: a glutathione-dependent thiol reductase [Asaia bogorensis]